MSRYLNGCVVTVRDIPVAVGKVDRRVLVADIDAEVGLITCVLNRIGQVARHSILLRRSTGGLLIPVSGADDAEGRVREQVGEERIGGSEQHGRFRRDLAEDGMILRHAQHLTISSLEPHVQSSRVGCAREKCAYACVQ